MYPIPYRAAACVLLCAGIATASAQNYPTKPIRYIVPTSAGSGADSVGRTVAAGLAEVFGQQVVVDNRAGAAGNLAAEIAAKAPPDGHTLFQVNFSHSVNITLYKDMAYDLLRDFAPVTQLGSAPAVVVVHPSLPVKSVAELVKMAKARPGAINFASAGTGSPTFVGAELFRKAAGIDMLHVPYRGGGEAITSIVAGETSVYFAPLSTAMPHVRSGRLRPLAVTAKQRLPLAPELPTIAEAGYPGTESGFWHGIMVPARTPKEIVARLHEATLAALKRPEVNKRLESIGYTVAADQPEQFLVFIRSEIERWKKVFAKPDGAPQ
jgi:tripartite-type tricarboxylate transporter receptor subunit TctC